MPATEELRVLIKTVADTSGVQQTQRALQQTRSGISAMGAAAIGGIAGGLAARLPDALGKITEGFASSIDAAREHERVVRATAMAYGQAAGQFSNFAQQLSSTTGFTTDAILQAALSARTLSQNYGLSIEQTQKLIRVSADLARVRGIGIAEAFERVQSAIRGEAEASEYLGLTLNDTYLKNQAMNGSLKSTYDTMSDVEKAQVRYNELLNQAAQFTDLASKNTDSLDAAFGRAETSANKLLIALGTFSKPGTTAGLNWLTDLANRLAAGFAGQNEDAVFNRWVQFLIQGKSLVDAIELTTKSIGREIELARQRQNLPMGSGPAGAGVPFDAAAVAKRIKDAAEAAVRPPVTVISRDLQDIKENADSVGRAALAAARLAYQDQIKAAVRELTNAQQAQLDLQHQSVDLAAQEAGIRLGMLPTQERLAALQRDVTEQQIRARIAALPASQALDNARAAAEHARLIQADLSQPIDRRRQALRDLINLQMRTLPGLELGAFEANEPVRLAGQAVERVGLEQQLFQLTQERTLAQIRLAEETNSLLSRIAEQRTQAIQLTIQLSPEDFRNGVYNELLEANNQAQGPATIPQSGTRRIL